MFYIKKKRIYYILLGIIIGAIVVYIIGYICEYYFNITYKYYAPLNFLEDSIILVCTIIRFVFTHFTFIIWLALYGLTLSSSDKKLRKLSQKNRQKCISFFDKFSDKDKYDRNNLFTVLRPDLTDEELLELEKHREEKKAEEEKVKQCKENLKKTKKNKVNKDKD